MTFLASLAELRINIIIKDDAWHIDDAHVHAGLDHVISRENLVHGLAHRSLPRNENDRFNAPKILAYGRFWRFQRVASMEVDAVIICSFEPVDGEISDRR